LVLNFGLNPNYIVKIMGCLYGTVRGCIQLFMGCYRIIRV
jgi:hypothetical protein